MMYIWICVCPEKVTGNVISVTVFRGAAGSPPSFRIMQEFEGGCLRSPENLDSNFCTLIMHICFYRVGDTENTVYFYMKFLDF